MSRKINCNIVWLLILFTSSIYAQYQEGIIEYRGVINKKYVDSFLTDIKQKNIPMNIKQGVIDTYLNATPDEFVLNFKNKESYYYINAPLDVEEGYNIGSNAGRNPFYTNNSTNTIIEQSPYLGNISHNPIDWEITTKTKIIGGFKCHQAIATEKLNSRKGGYYYRKVVAWFAPEIPLNFGPKYYKGLPGLILEIDRDKFTLTARTINLNPKGKDVKIKNLNKDNNAITQKEASKRIAEMEDDRKKRQKSE